MFFLADRENIFVYFFFILISGFNRFFPQICPTKCQEITTINKTKTKSSSQKHTYFYIYLSLYLTNKQMASACCQNEHWMQVADIRFKKVSKSPQTLLHKDSNHILCLCLKDSVLWAKVCFYCDFPKGVIAVKCSL